MKVLDNFLFRCWQMGWLEKYETNKSPWISVNDDLPCNHGDLVLTYNGTPFITKSVLVTTSYHALFICDMRKDDTHRWVWDIATKDDITHWMPIPESPKE